MNQIPNNIITRTLARLIPKPIHLLFNTFIKENGISLSRVTDEISLRHLNYVNN